MHHGHVFDPHRIGFIQPQYYALIVKQTNFKNICQNIMTFICSNVKVVIQSYPCQGFFLHHFLSEIRINWSGKPLKCLSLYSYLHNRCSKAYTKFTKFGLSSFNTLRLSSIKSMLYLKNFSNHLSNCKIFLIWCKIYSTR